MACFLCLTPPIQSHGNNTENSIFYLCGCKNKSLYGPDPSESPFQNERRCQDAAGAAAQPQDQEHLQLHPPHRQGVSVLQLLQLLNG